VSANCVPAAESFDALPVGSPVPLAHPVVTPKQTTATSAPSRPREDVLIIVMNPLIDSIGWIAAEA
jgi:hypothetical protein